MSRRGLPGTRRGAAALLALLAVLTFVIYRPALDHYFIADDLTILDFVRSYRGSWLAFLDPARMYSDPVTRTRYKPLSIYYFVALDALFGDHAFGYHVASLLLHALVGAMVWRLAWSLYRDRIIAAGAAALFIAWRLDSQAVVWISTSSRLPSTALVLLSVILARESRGRFAVPVAVASFACALAMNPDMVLLPVILAFFLLEGDDARSTGADPARQRRTATVLAGCAIVAALFVLASWRSARAFPERPMSLAPDPTRVLLFTTNLLVPFALPLSLKIALAGGVIIAAVSLRDRRVWLLLACAATSALLWGALRAYPLMPRYLYLSWAFGAIVVARLLCAIAFRGATAFPAAWVPSFLRERERRRSAAALITIGPLVLASGWSVRAVDLVHFEYLALLGQRLSRVQAEARLSGRRINVFVQPFSHLGGSDLAFFRREIEFVPSPATANRIVDTDLARYRRRLGPRMGDDYWYFPWFDDKLDRRSGVL